MYGTLIERLEKAKESDRRLDADLACALIFRDRRPAEPNDFDGKYGYSAGNIKCDHGFLMAEFYTSSLDAAIGLVERVLPGWGWGVNSAGMAMVFKETPMDEETFSFPDHQDQDNPPQVALLIALLKALEAREGE